MDTANNYCSLDDCPFDAEVSFVVDDEFEEDEFEDDDELDDDVELDDEVNPLQATHLPKL